MFLKIHRADIPIMNYKKLYRNCRIWDRFSLKFEIIVGDILDFWIKIRGLSTCRAIIKKES